MITLLTDAHGVGYRAYHSLGGLSHKGSATGVAFGFLSLILDLSKRYRTNQFVFAWDSPGSVRKRAFPEYKQSRATKTPEELAERSQIHQQFDSLRTEILPAAGFINNLFRPGYEADDIIASAVIDNPDQLFVVVSSDHDLYQLLQYHNCKEQYQLSGKVMTASKFMVEYGIPARDWISVKSIAGCDGDGVPGIPGVGEKTAIKYLLDALSEKRASKISNYTDFSKIVHRNYNLVRLPFPGMVAVEICKDEFSEDALFQTFDDLGFNSFLSGEKKQLWQQFCSGEWK